MTQKRDRDERERSTGGQGEYESLAQKGGEHAAQTPGSASNLALHFRGVDFPASKQDLLRHLEQTNAPDEIRKTVQNMADQRFGSMADVMAAWGREK